MIRHGRADGAQARVFLVEAAQAAGAEILLGFDLQGDDGAAQLEQENDRLQDKIDILGSVDSVEQIAREQLGLEYPSGIIFNPGK